jgi:hypothetical protein
MPLFESMTFQTAQTMDKVRLIAVEGNHHLLRVFHIPDDAREYADDIRQGCHAFYRQRTACSKINNNILLPETWHV